MLQTSQLGVTMTVTVKLYPQKSPLFMICAAAANTAACHQAFQGVAMNLYNILNDSHRVLMVTVTICVEKMKTQIPRVAGLQCFMKDRRQH